MSSPSGGATVLDTPHHTIGAQDLLAVGSCTKYGHLRKQGGLERTFKFMKWPQRFVVISRGCVYVFKNELSRSPSKTWSLKTFKKCMRFDHSTARWSFRVLPRHPEIDKPVIFACVSDEIRKEWMAAFKEEMIMATHVLQSAVPKDEPPDLDDYAYLEKEVLLAAPDPGPKPKRERKTTKEDDIGEEDSDKSDSEDYSTIDEAHMGVPHPEGKSKSLPPPKQKPTFKVNIPTTATLPTVHENKELKMGKKKNKVPTPPPSPTMPVSPAKSDISRTSFEFAGTDRKAVENLLLQRPDGTFLVRKSRNDNKEVLSINIDGALKEFKIYEKDKKFTIDNEEYFPSVEALIANYYAYVLPKKSSKLMRAYSQTDPGYINQM